MNETYEIRLREEFELLQKLQRHPSVNNDTIKITIQYKDRLRGGNYKSVLENPSSGMYPNSFRVTYQMPMYVGHGQLKRDWQATFLFSVPESVLMNPHSSLEAKIEGDKFPDGSIPYHNHVSRSGSWFCQGGSWGAAQQGNGIWYFIVALGSILNMDRGFVVEDSEDARHHLNYDAFLYWKDERNMQPVSAINWPFNLPQIPTFGKPTSGDRGSQKPKFSFGKSEQKKPTFNFGPKK